MHVLLFVFSFLIFGACCGYGHGHKSEEWKEGKKAHGNAKPWNYDTIGGFHDGDTFYPCEYEDDLDCIRQFFAGSGQCKKVQHHYVRRPVLRERLDGDAPSINITWVATKSRIKYIGDRISRFYVNKKTENLIMAVDFEAINIHSKLVHLLYQLRGEEPITKSDVLNATYAITLTAVIPVKGEINGEDTSVTAYIAAIPSFFVGPNILNSTEPIISQVNTALFANLPTVVLELFSHEAPSLFFGYLQNFICDFGFPIST